MPNFLEGLGSPASTGALNAIGGGLGVRNVGTLTGAASTVTQSLQNTSGTALTNIGFNAAVALTSGASLSTAAATAASSLTGVSFAGIGGLLGLTGGLSGTKPAGLQTEFAVGEAAGKPFYSEKDIIFTLVRADMSTPSTPTKQADAAASANTPIGTLGTLAAAATAAGAITGNSTVKNVATGLAVAKAVTGLFGKKPELPAVGGGGGLSDIPATSIQDKDASADIPTEWQFITAPQDVSWNKTSRSSLVETFGTNAPFVTYGATSLRKMNLGNAMIEGFSDGKQVEGNINNLEVAMNMVLQNGYSAPYCWKVFAGEKNYGSFIITDVKVREAMRDFGGKSTRAFVDVELQEVPAYQVSGGIDLASAGPLAAKASAAATAASAASSSAAGSQDAKASSANAAGSTPATTASTAKAAAKSNEPAAVDPSQRIR